MALSELRALTSAVRGPLVRLLVSVRLSLVYWFNGGRSLSEGVTDWTRLVLWGLELGVGGMAIYGLVIRIA